MYDCDRHCFLAPSSSAHSTCDSVNVVHDAHAAECVSTFRNNWVGRGVSTDAALSSESRNRFRRSSQVSIVEDVRGLAIANE